MSKQVRRFSALLQHFGAVAMLSVLFACFSLTNAFLNGTLSMGDVLTVIVSIGVYFSRKELR